MIRREEETGQASYPLVAGWGVVFLTGLVAWLVLGAVTGEAPFAISTPAPEGRFERIAGGFTAPAGLIVLLIGLVMYTAAYIAEIVRRE